MTRLIDAEALKKELTDAYFYDETLEVSEIKQIIDNAPTVEERPQGEWIDIDGDGSLWKCSKCGKIQCCHGKYCSDCGADMRTEKGTTKNE